jgi:NAD(P)H dehydrogenase (quinone)
MNVLTVFDHPRRGSLCGAILDSFVNGLSEKGHVCEIADLYRENFDPRMTIADEPDWKDTTKIYSSGVLREQHRIARNDAIVLVFPVWWWSFPAMTKGWIDRVWNNGWAYGAQKLPHKKALLIAIGSGTAESYAKRKYDQAIQTQLVQGTLHYCGIENARLEIFFGSLDSDEIRKTLIDRI